MSQKTITSFFGKPKAANKSEVEQKKSDEKAPSKLTNNDGKLIANLDKKKATEKLDDKSVSQIVEATEQEDSPIKAAPKRKSKAISSDEGSGDEAKSEPLKVKKPLKTYSNGKSKSKKNKITDEKTKDLFPKSEARSDSKTKKSKIKEERAKQPSPEPESKPESKPKEGDVKEENVKEPSPEPQSKPESTLTKDGSVDDGAKTSVKTEAKSMLVTVEIAEYNPSKAGYHPIKDACWKHGEKVPYLALAKTLELIEATSSRLKMIEILANFLRSVIVLSPTDLLQSIYLCLNQLAPAYVGLELGVGDTILIKALAQATGRSVDKIKADAAAKGDLGLVAEASKGTQRIMFQPAPLTVKTVFDKLKDIAAMTGTASQGKKVDKIQSLLVACRQTEARYIIRSLAGKLRIGLAEQSVLQAIAQACTLTPPNQPYPPETLNSGKGLSADALKAKIDENAMLIKTAYCQCPSYDRIVPVLLEHGVAALPSHCSLTPGVPLKPMLACPTRGVSEVLQRFDNADFTCEWKYDGERAQIHLTEDGAVHIYSRNQEDNTSKYPDVINRFKTCLQPTVKSCIIDSEAVAWDREKKQLLPFQILSTRKRKDANEAEIKVQVCIFAFDMLYLNGEALVREPLKRRRELLHQSLKEVEGEFQYATGKDPKTTEEIEEFLDESLKGHCEGLMVKALEKHATYEIARRSHNWLKLKKDYLEGVGDTIDAVVIGGYLGTGKRTGNYGGFLLACYDNENEEFQSLCKIGTGFSDEDFANHAKFFKDHLAASPKSYYRFDPSLAPDHWFEPVQVWEVKCADLSISPVHRAAVGIVHPEKGISLRFPRFLRIREDKNSEDATSAQQIADLYNNQEQIKNSGDFAKGMDEEEGFY